MGTTYTHTNIVTDNWERLADFYQRVFDCVPVPPTRDQQGHWLDRGLGITNAHLRGVHLRLPGHGLDGPTLEIYQHRTMEGAPNPTANTKGLRHLAFHVDDVTATQNAVLAAGGSNIGQIVDTVIEGVGKLAFVYVADPDGNIIELQNWS